MDQQSEELKERIRSGKYYEDARKWYSVVYMTLVSERLHYIILSIVGGIIMVTALKTLTDLIPLAPAEPFLYVTNNVDSTIPKLIRLKNDVEEPADTALRRQFVSTYLQSRESYSRENIAKNNAVIFRYSTPQVYNQYRRYMDPSNPRSPMLLYGAYLTRSISVDDIKIYHENGKLDNKDNAEDLEETEEPRRFYAKLKFTSTVHKPTGDEVSHWETRIDFIYKPIKYKKIMSKEEYVDKLKVEPMEFKVTEYKATLVK